MVHICAKLSNEHELVLDSHKAKAGMIQTLTLATSLYFLCTTKGRKNIQREKGDKSDYSVVSDYQQEQQLLKRRQCE